MEKVELIGRLKNARSVDKKWRNPTVISKALTFCGAVLIGLFGLSFLLSPKENLAEKITVTLKASKSKFDFTNLQESLGELIIANRHHSPMTLHSASFC
jgi:hypothetical protein